MPSRKVLLAALAALLVLGVGCDSDSPSEPNQTPQPPPPPGGSVTVTYQVTVTANPNEINALDQPSTITVTVRRADNGQFPPNGTAVQLSTTLGEFGAIGSGEQTGFVELQNGSAQVLLFPGEDEGTAVVRATIQDSFGTATVRVLEAIDPDRFFLESVAPRTGSPNGGDLVRITGSGFDEPLRVFIGDLVADVIDVTPTQIRARTPAITLPVGQTQSVDVTVTNDLGGEEEATDSLPSAFTYTRGGGGPLQPAIFNVSPQLGPNEGGTQVVIEGDGFQQPVQVLFGSGTDAATFSGVEAQVNSVTQTRIVAISPPATAFGQNNLNSQVNILVRNTASGSAAISTNAFRYGVPVLITSIGPGEGPYTGGTRVTIFGQGFDEPVAVSLAGAVQDPISVTGTEILVQTEPIDPASCQDVTGPTVVTNIETGSGDTGPDFTYRVVAFTPRITGIDPSSGDDGDIVTISGSNLSGDIEVTFGDARAQIVQQVSASQLRVRVPFLPEDEFRTEACDDNGDGFSGTRLLDTPVDVTVTNVLTSCTSSPFTRGFVYDPPSSACNNDIGPAPPANPPEAAFTVQGVGGNTVQFIDGSTNGPTSWVWDFDTSSGGAQDSTVQNPQHTYPGAGNFAVSLTVSNAGGSDTVVQVITVPPP